MVIAYLAPLVVGVGVLSVLSLRGVKRLFDLSHPWWTHLPAACALWAGVGLAGLLALDGWPVHYVNNVNVVPEPWRFVGSFVGVSLLLIGVFVLIDELWARQETRKTFNWMSLLDEAVVVPLVFSAFASLDRTARGASAVPTIWTLVVAAAAVVLAAMLELARPYVAHEDLVQAEDTSALDAELGRRRAAGERIVYWEAQNPAYVTGLIVVVSGALAFGAVIAYRAMPWISFFMVCAAGAMFLLYGGLRVSAREGLVEVRLGMLGIRLLTMPTSEIAEVTVHAFAPLKDFGGYGIRVNREMRAYFFRGNRGVLLRTTRGKQYLVGSDRPERLATVLRAVAGQQ